MQCPYCQHSYALTWQLYFKAPTGRHVCPNCSKPFNMKFRVLTFSILLIVCLVFSLPGAMAADRWLGRAWRGLGVLPSLLVIIPLARYFEDKHKQSIPIEDATPRETAPCAECGQVFKVNEMIAHNAIHVCARCKPIFLQKLAEGAKIKR